MPTSSFQDNGTVGDREASQKEAKVVSWRLQLLLSMAVEPVGNGNAAVEEEKTAQAKRKANRIYVLAWERA